MAKKRKPKKTAENIEEIPLVDDKEYKNTLYIFLFTFIGAILFLIIYLIGLINILLK